MNQDIAISVEHLSKRYLIGGKQRHWSIRDTIDEFLHHPFGIGATKRDKQEFWALDDVSFEVKKGDVVGIIGRNGSGKSTLLKILARIVEPTKGKVTMRGRVASLLEVGTGFNPELTGRENIYLNGAILGMSRAEITSKFDEIVTFSGIEQFIDTPVKRYSSGMYVRLAFAVAAHLDSDILLVDEVLAVGDAEFQKKCLGKMKSLSKGGRTVLFVSHDLVSIQKLCKHSLLLSNGEVVDYAETKDVLQQYLITTLSLRDHYAMKCVFNSKHKLFSNDLFKLKEISIVDTNRNEIKQLFTDTPFLIKMNYEILRSDTSVGLSLIFKNEQGVEIFSSINNLDSNLYGKPLSKGSYCEYCFVPENFLNDDTYVVDLNIFSFGYSNVVTATECLTISVSDSKTIRGDFSGKYGGLIRPKLSWLNE